MRVIVQRVIESKVVVDEKIVSEIKNGLLLLVGIEYEDTKDDIEYLTNKISQLRIFNDENGIMNKSIIETNGEILSVSQFTLFASTKKGNRPSYIRAAKGDFSEPMYHTFCSTLSEKIKKEVKKGIFGADMKIHLINDGPVTIIIDSKNKEY